MADSGGPAQLAQVVGVAVAAAVLATWPAVLSTAVPGLPGGEVVDHAWALWLGLREGLVAESALLDFPTGTRWVLADPLNLLWFAPGLLFGAGPAVTALHVGNLALVGVAGAALWRVVLRGDRPGALFCAAVGPTLPVLATGLFTGMTEAQTMGWLGLAVAATWWALREGGWGRAVAAGLVVGLTMWAGVYTAIYTAFAVGGIAVGGVWSGGPGRTRRLAHAVGIAVVALVLASPVAWAVLVERDPNLPGGASMAAAVFEAPFLPQNRMLSGDLLGLVHPRATAELWPEGAPEAPAATHVSYLGLVFAGLAIGGVWVRRSGGARALAASACLLLVLGLGYQLQVGSEPVAIGDNLLMMPAGILSLEVPFLGRASRWYRAHMAAAVLLIPFAAAGAQALTERLPRSRAVGLGVLAALVTGDALLSGALPWPRPVFDAVAPAGLAELDGDGPLLLFPVPRGGADEDGVRNPALLWQVEHGRPIGGNPQVSRPQDIDGRVVRLERELVAAAQAGESGAASTQVAGELGFEWLVYAPVGPVPVTRQQLITALGPPDVETTDLAAWRLSPSR